MKERRDDVLERNLEALLTRAYAPVEPSVAFRARVERELAPWIARAASRRRSIAPWLAAAGLLVTALVAWRTLGSARSDLEPAAIGQERHISPVTLLLKKGSVAVGLLPGERWRAATPAELQGGIDGSYRDASLRLYTPAASGITLRDGPALELRIDPKSCARFDRREDCSDLRLVFGCVAARAGARPARLRTYQGDVALTHAAARLTVELGGAPNLQACPVLVEVLAGRARLDCGGPSIELEAPRRARMAGGAVELLDEPPAEGAPAEAGSTRESLAAPADEAGEATEAQPGSAAPAGAFIGTVIDAASGEPVRAFEVTLLRAVDLPRVSWPESRRFESADGRFEWSGLEPGEYAVFVQAEGHAAWKEASIELADGDARALAIELALGASVHGFVVDRASALPIAGAFVVSESDAPVEVLPLDPSDLPSEVRALAITGPDGSFELAHLASGSQVVRASAPGHGQVRTSRLSVREGEALDGLLFELQPGGAIEGRVERRDGTPWAGARVVASEYVAQNASPMTFGSALTDAAGSYRIEPLAPGSYVVLVFSDEETNESMRPDLAAVNVERGATTRADFLHATAKGRLFGRVLGAGGEPLASVTVNLSLVGEESAFDWRAATTGADGSYTLDDVEPGAYLVHVGSGSGIVLQTTLQVAAGEALERDFTVQGSRLFGTVVDARSGAAAEGFVLLLVPHVDPNGTPSFPAHEPLVGKTWPGGGAHYEFPFLPPGRYDLVALSADGHYALRVVEDVAIVDGADARVDLELLLAGSLALRCVDAAGAPLSGARIELVDPHGRRIDWLEETTDAEGRARVGSLEPGVWRVRARSPDGRRAEVQVAVDPGAEREETLVLPR